MMYGEITSAYVYEDNAGGLSVYAMDGLDLVWAALYDTDGLGPEQAAADYEAITRGEWQDCWELGGFTGLAQAAECGGQIASCAASGNGGAARVACWSYGDSAADGLDASAPLGHSGRTFADLVGRVGCATC